MRSLSYLLGLILLALVDAHGNHVHKAGKSAKVHQNHASTCGSHTKSQQLMLKNKEYKVKHELEKKRADEYVAWMKQNKDHSFRRDVSPFSKKNKNKNDNSMSNDERRNLFSTYDDEIGNTPVIRIPVIYHVLYSTDSGNLPDAQLQSQIDVLNKDFRALNEEIMDGEVDNVFKDRVGDTKLEYYLNATYRKAIASDDMCANETLFKKSEYGGLDAIDPKYNLNVWICNITSAGLLGYAYQPCLLDTTSEWMDGLVLGTDNVGSKEDDTDGTFWFPDGTTYNLGRTGTHEIGHYLNLDHIWGTSDEATCDDTDYVSDTPSSLEANYGCPDNSTNTCYEVDPELGKDLRDMYENFMDYSNDACMFIFTEEQVWRMRSVLSGNGCRREMYYAGVELDANQTLMPSSVRTTGGSFTCDDGCVIAEDYINDNACDCSNCEDEDDWSCSQCGNCPTSCGGYVECSSSGSSGSSSSGIDGATVIFIVLVVVVVAIIGGAIYYRYRNKDGGSGDGGGVSDAMMNNNSGNVQGNIQTDTDQTGAPYTAM